MAAPATAAAVQAAAEPKEAPVTVRSLAGEVLVVVPAAPADVRALKDVIEAETGTPAALQRLVEAGGGRRVLADDERLPLEAVELCMVVDETALKSWDLQRNPARAMLKVEGSTLTCPGLQSDYVTVLTREPLRSGAHYFQFAMHRIGDEQWCGVVEESSVAGDLISGRSIRGWSYYCGRMGSQASSLRNGMAALHAAGRAVKRFDRPRPSGDCIGMLVDLDRGAVAFDLNGTLQGSCAVPREVPLYLFTHVDEPEDCVELLKLPVSEAPADLREAIQRPEFPLGAAGEQLSSYDMYRAGAQDDDWESPGGSSRGAGDDDDDDDG